MILRRFVAFTLLILSLPGLMACETELDYQNSVNKPQQVISQALTTTPTPLLQTPTIFALPSQATTITKAETPFLLVDRKPVHPQPSSQYGLAIEIYHVNRPVLPEENGYEQVQGFLINESRWGEPGLRSWWEKMREANNQDLAPFGYHLEGIFQPPSSTSFTVYHNDQVVMDDIEWFLPVSVNRSKTDFLMVVGPTSQETKVIRN